MKGYEDADNDGEGDDENDKSGLSENVMMITMIRTMMTDDHEADDDDSAVSEKVMIKFLQTLQPAAAAVTAPRFLA